MRRTIQRTAAIVLGLMLGVAAWGGLETVTHISDLNSSWPLGSDLASTSDDHIRNIKVALKTDFPNINAAVTGTPTQLNNLTGNLAFAASNWSTGNTITANSFIPTSTTVPVNGMYLSGTNTLAFASATTTRGNVNSTGAWSIPGATSGTTFAVSATNGSTGVAIDVANNNAAINNPVIRMLNFSATAQNGIDSYSNSASNLIGRIRNDFAGNWSYVGFLSGSHVFYTGGDSGTGTSRFQVNASAPFVQGFGTTAAGLVDMSPDTGTFTATYTGFTAGVTCTATWSRIGKLVILAFCAATGTSNATSFTMTGLPAAIQPATLTQSSPVGLGSMLDNSGALNTPLSAKITAASGTITFFNGGGSNAFTSSGTKGFSSFGATTSFLLN